jgi:hypothetical protein
MYAYIMYLYKIARRACVCMYVCLCVYSSYREKRLEYCRGTSVVMQRVSPPQDSLSLPLIHLASAFNGFPYIPCEACTLVDVPRYAYSYTYTLVFTLCVLSLSACPLPFHSHSLSPRPGPRLCPCPARRSPPHRRSYSHSLSLFISVCTSDA